MIRRDNRFAIVIQHVGPEIAVKVFLGHQPSAPRGHSPGAIVQRTDNIGPIGVIIGF